MRFQFPKSALLVLLFSAASAGPGKAVDFEALLKEFHAIPAVTGNEELLAAKIASLLPPAFLVEKDNLGGLYARSGGRSAGAPVAGGIAILAPMDDFGYVVSGFTADGYLRLDRASAPPSPVYDSFLMGHPVVLQTAKGLQPGLISQPAMHVLTRELRETIAGAFSLDLVYADVGVRSESAARAKGFEILDAVSLWPDYVTLAGSLRAGPNLGRKAAAVALSAAAAAVGSAARLPAVTFGWTAQSRLTARGTRTSLGLTRAANLLSPDKVIVLDSVAALADGKTPVFGRGLVLVVTKGEASPLRTAIEAFATRKKIPLQLRVQPESPLLAPFALEGTEVVGLALPVKFPGTPSEVVDLKDIQALSDLVSGLLVSGELK